jgi:DNA helicase-2/ATP-dependent DNA helicase PcrA
MEMADRFGSTGSLGEFSEELVRRAQSHDEPTMPAVTLATVHSAKGQEWKVVAVVGLSVGQFPISYATTEDELAEERRLFYVALTRAQERLVLSWSTHGQPGRGTARSMSPFLAELGIAV